MSNPAYSYAKALNEILVKEQLPDFLKFFQQIRPALQQEEKFFISPMYALDFKKQVLNFILELLKTNSTKKDLPDVKYSSSSSIHVINILKNVLFLLLDRGRWREWPRILQYLEEINQDLQNSVLAEVISSHPLEKDLKYQLQKKLESFFKKSVVLKESLSSKLLAGIKIKAGGFVFDDSISFHLKQMELEARRDYVNTG